MPKVSPSTTPSASTFPSQSQPQSEPAPKGDPAPGGEPTALLRYVGTLEHTIQFYYGLDISVAHGDRVYVPRREIPYYPAIGGEWELAEPDVAVDAATIPAPTSAAAGPEGSN